MGKKVASVKGTRDLLPPETDLWAAVEATARRVFGLYGYREIRTPILESTELFVRSVGAATDIIGKEMYSFEDRKGRSLSLRPESTASVARAFVQHGLHHEALPARLFYIGPQFRYERPQKGRYRQLHQIGAELIGDPGPESDAEVIAMLTAFLGACGFDDLTVLLHSVGDEASRDEYRRRLVAFLEPHREELGADSARRLATNPLRILDTKDRRERRILAGAPRLEESLTEASRRHFGTVCATLERLGVAYELAPHLVRGLDYYTHTVFEIVAAGLGAQDALVGGGRYDRLIAELGGPDLPAIGFAIGQDRLLDVLPDAFRQAVRGAQPALVAVVDPLPVAAGLELAEELRGAGVTVVVDFARGTLSAALKRAARRGTRWVAILGEDELAAGTVTCRDMEQGEQQTVARSAAASLLGGRR